MWRLLQLELYKLSRQRGLALAFGAVLLIDVVCLAVAYSEGKAILDFATANLQEVFVLQGDLLNGSLVSLLILNSLWFHLPLVVIIASASLVGSEFKDGSLRNVLCRPVGRSSYLVAKYIAVATLSFCLVGLLAVSSMGMSYALFGSGDLLVFMDTLNILPAGEAVWRLIGAFALGGCSMVAIGLMAATFASYLESTVVAILASLFVLIALTILDKSSLLAGSWVRQISLMGHVSAWQYLFGYTIPWGEVARSLFWLLGYSLSFVGLGVWNFRRKDITC